MDNITLKVVLVISLNINMWKAVNIVLASSKYSVSDIYCYASSNHIWKSNVVERKLGNHISIIFHCDNQASLPDISGSLSSRHMVVVHFKVPCSFVGYVTS